MNRRGICLALLITLTSFLSLPGLADGLRSIGVRAVLPMGRSPFLVGIEATGDVSLGVLTGSFFLSGDAKTLITLSYDLQLAGDTDGSRTFVRCTTGLYYFDQGRFLPSVLFGGGLALEVPLTSALALAASGEFLYPWAFPVPFVTASGRWTLP